MIKQWNGGAQPAVFYFTSGVFAIKLSYHLSPGTLL